MDEIVADELLLGVGQVALDRGQAIVGAGEVRYVSTATVTTM